MIASILGTIWDIFLTILAPFIIYGAIRFLGETLDTEDVIHKKKRKWF